jgi:hypothetical protein
MNIKTAILTSLGTIALSGVLVTTSVSDAQTSGMDRRGERRDDREGARDEKRECKAGDEKSRPECRQDTREGKQEDRHDGDDDGDGGEKTAPEKSEGSG